MKKELFRDGAKVSRQKANAMLSKWTTGERNCKDSREGAFAAWDRLLSDFGETERPFKGEGSLYLFEDSDRPIALSVKQDFYHGWSVCASRLY